MADQIAPSLQRVRPSRLPKKPELDLAELNSGKPWPARVSRPSERYQCYLGSTAAFNIEPAESVRDAMARRVEHLASESLARRHGQRIVFARELLDTLRRRELESAGSKLSSETRLSHQPSLEGEHVSEVYRQRVALASGRFAMIDDGLGFQLVPWRPALEQHLRRHVSGVVTPGGGMDWSFGRKRGLGL